MASSIVVLDTPMVETITCCWKWNPKGKEKWKLIEASPTHNNGDPYLKDALDIEDFLSREVTRFNRIDYPGRAVTVWTILNGVQLHRLNLAESEFNGILVAESRDISKLQTWYKFVRDGSTMHLATATQVRAIQEEDRKTKPDWTKFLRKSWK